jgi:DNA-binding GntR family transcriptional regulator
MQPAPWREEVPVFRGSEERHTVRARRAEDLSDTFQPLARATLQEGVYDQVCAALMDGRLRPGQKISLRSLAAAMNTSPMPVREALRRLEAGHVLELRAGGVLAVPQPSRGELLEIRDIRMSLEGLAAEQAAARMTKKELDRTARLGAAMRDADARPDVAAFVAMNREFHFAIYEAAQSPLLLSMIKSLWLRVAPFFLAICQHHGQVAFSIEQHDRALQALLRRDGAGARKAIEADIERAAERIGALLEGAANGADVVAPRRKPAAAKRGKKQLTAAIRRR